MGEEDEDLDQPQPPSVEDDLLIDEMGGEMEEGDFEEGEEEEDLMKTISEVGLSPAERKKIYMQYLSLVKEIENQNRVVDELKMTIAEKCMKTCRTRCEEREIKNLRSCLEKENLKLQCLIHRAMQLQGKDPGRLWNSIDIVTTFEEDSMPMGIDFKQMCPRGKPKDPCIEDRDVTNDEIEEYLLCLMEKAKQKKKEKANICGPCGPCIPNDKEDNRDEKLIKKILCAMKTLQRKPPCPCPCGLPRPPPCPCGQPCPPPPCPCGQPCPPPPCPCGQPCPPPPCPCGQPCPPPPCPCGQPCPQPCKKRKQKDNVCDRMSKELNRSYSMQERLAADNAGLEGDRYRLQEEVMTRDDQIEMLQKKIKIMQSELGKLCCVQQQCKTSQATRKVCPPKPNNDKKMKCLERNLEDMQRCVEEIKMDICRLRKERDQLQRQKQLCESESTEYCPCSPSPTPCPCPPPPTISSPCPIKKNKNTEIEELKKNYTYLLAEFAKKDAALKELKENANKICGGNAKSNTNDKIENCELEMLREQVCDLQEEQDEFKCLIKEQSDQLEDYRRKYLTAQQKVEEQKCILDKLDMNNKRIEEQINLEVQRIKSKFQEKLNELAQYPKLLENEQIKLAAACQEKGDLEAKLRLVCKELKSCKAQIESLLGKPDCAAALAKCQQEYALLENELEMLKKDKLLICEQLERTKEELDTLRTESAKIIARTKERAECQRLSLQERIDTIEKDLAQCRATACLSINDREEVIKEMQGQLSTLSYSFDSAQKQIKTLRNHISFLSNDNCYPVKC